MQNRALIIPLFILFACGTKDNDQGWDATATTTEDDDRTSVASNVDDSGLEDSGGSTVEGKTVWTGPTLTFTKENYADPNDAANQDAITNSVILTRGSRGSLFNIAIEESANSTSPSGTQWAKGTTADIASLTFEPLKKAADNQMSRLPGTDYVLHLVDENIYIDVKFLSWTSGGSSGGGFSYERSTNE